MKKHLLFLKDLLILPIVLLAITLCCLTLHTPITNDALADTFREICLGSYTVPVAAIAIIVLQLIAMRWAKVLLSLLLTLSSILLFFEMATVALGPGISMTASLHKLATAYGIAHPLSDNPALYWLIPSVWFLCLIGASTQVRSFCTAMVCYAAWLIGTPLLQSAINSWAEEDEPLLPQLLTRFTDTEWMAAATVGGFLLLFALILDILGAIFANRKDA